MLNELLYRFATWLDSQTWSTNLHESYYMYNWVESTHVLTLMIFLGMLVVIDLRMLGLAFKEVPVSTVADRLEIPMMIGVTIMMITGFLLFYAIPVRTTTSIWFRIKVVLIICAAVNALLIRNITKNHSKDWDHDPIPPKRIRVGAGLSIAFWAGVIITGRLMAYDWWDCHKEMPYFMYWAAGCINELAAFE